MTLIPVPDVAGLTQAEAEAALVNAGLAVDLVWSWYRANVPPGEVLGQDTPAGTLVPPGSGVGLAVAGEPPPDMEPTTIGSEGGVVAIGGGTIEVPPDLFTESATITTGTFDPSYSVYLNDSEQTLSDAIAISHDAPSSAIARDSEGLILTLPFDAAAVPPIKEAGTDDTVFDVFVRCQFGNGYSVRLFGTVEGDTITVSANPSPDAVYQVVYDPLINVQSFSMDDESDVPAKLLSRRPPWLTRKFLVINSGDIVLKKAIYITNHPGDRRFAGKIPRPELVTNKKIDELVEDFEAATISEEDVDAFVFKEVGRYAPTAATWFEQNLALREPVLNHDRRDSEDYFVIQVDSTWNAARWRNLITWGDWEVDPDYPSAYREVSHDIILGAESLVITEDTVTPPADTVAHELFHACFAGYDIPSANVPPDSDGTDTSDDWLNEGLASLVGTTFIAENRAVSVRDFKVDPDEEMNLRNPLCSSVANTSHEYSHAEFFAFLFKKYHQGIVDVLGYTQDGNVKGLVEYIREYLALNWPGDEATEQQEMANRMALASALNNIYQANLGYEYWDFACNRFYDNGEASNVRDGDEDSYCQGDHQDGRPFNIKKHIPSNGQSVEESYAMEPLASDWTCPYVAPGMAGKLVCEFNTVDWDADDAGNSVRARLYCGDRDVRGSGATGNAITLGPRQNRLEYFIDGSHNKFALLVSNLNLEKSNNVTVQFSVKLVPYVKSFSINGGASYTSSPSVRLGNTCIGATPTHYMAWESESFSGARWRAYSAAPSFPLSSGYGDKTIWFKVKNAAGESNIVHATITLEEGAATPGETQTIQLTEGVGLDVVWIPAGTFAMGRAANETGSSTNESPQHQVTLRQGFWMGKYEVTKAQWKAVMGTEPWAERAYVPDYPDPNSPAEYVTWADAQAFVSEASDITRKTFRLPTEAEWERACRANTTTRFYWGNDPNRTQIGDCAWYKGNSSLTAEVVGQKDPNAWNLYDMSGNVREWCQDFYGAYSSAAVIDPTGPATGTQRIVRGGGWDNEPKHCRSAYREPTNPSLPSFGRGFRVAGSWFPWRPPKVTLASPNGGEVWHPGDTVSIRWTSAGDAGSFVSLDLFSGSGTLSRTIMNSQPNREGANALEWTVPEGQGLRTDYYIQVKSTSRSTVSDRSDGVFTVASYKEPGQPKTVLLPGGEPLEMVWVPAGTFQMGSPSTEDNRSLDEGPQHQVTLTRGFWLGKYEVTKAQWQAVMGTTPWLTNRGKPRSYVLDDRNSPAADIGPTKADEFILKLNQLTEGAFRLPTEAEWEYACRADSTTRFYWDNDPYLTRIGDYAWYYGNAASANERYAHVVGQKLPNAWGLFDMSGNVWEICQDKYRAYSAGAAVDPTVPSDNYYRVIRGGGYNSKVNCRSANRYDYSGGGGNMGFRVAASCDHPAASAFTVSSPNGGETWHAGEDVSIAWQSAGGEDDAVTIELCYGVDGVGATIVQAAPNASGDNTFTWTIPEDQERRTDYFVRVKSAAQPRVYDRSDGLVTISAAPFVPETETILLPGNVPLEMVHLSAGTFRMGRNYREQDSDSDEDPQHSVTLTRDFWLGKYEVTKAQWYAAMGTSPWDGKQDVSTEPNSPAVYVKCTEALSFIRQLNATQNGKTFRLPTEAEWEYACRAETATRFYWGDDASYTAIKDNAWYKVNAQDAGQAYAHVVGQKLPNRWGLHDMAGNASEWCQDRFSRYPDGSVPDPIGGQTGSNYIYRGGAFRGPKQDCRSAGRNSVYEDRFSSIGFRLAGTFAGGGLPDLVPGTVSIDPASPTIDDEVILEASIQNIGSSAAGTFSWEILVDGNIVGNGRPASLGAGGSLTNISINAGTLTAGEHRVDFVVDTENEVAESDETNNTEGPVYFTVSSGNEPPPDTPQWARATLSRNDAIRVWWPASADATQYEVWRAEFGYYDSAVPPGDAVRVATVSETEYIDLEAQASIWFLYWVRAKNSEGNSGYRVSDLGFRRSTSPDLFVEMSNLEYLRTRCAYLSVYNAGGGTFSWTASIPSGTDWLHIAGPIQGANSGAFFLRADADAPQQAQGLVRVSAPGALYSPWEYPLDAWWFVQPSPFPDVQVSFSNRWPSVLRVSALPDGYVHILDPLGFSVSFQGLAPDERLSLGANEMFKYGQKEGWHYGLGGVHVFAVNTVGSGTVDFEMRENNLYARLFEAPEKYALVFGAVPTWGNSFTLALVEYPLEYVPEPGKGVVPTSELGFNTIGEDFEGR